MDTKQKNAVKMRLGEIVNSLAQAREQHVRDVLSFETVNERLENRRRQTMASLILDRGKKDSPLKGLEPASQAFQTVLEEETEKRLVQDEEVQKDLEQLKKLRKQILTQEADMENLRMRLTALRMLVHLD